jgi:hypothetical protein
MEIADIIDSLLNMRLWLTCQLAAKNRAAVVVPSLRRPTPAPADNWIKKWDSRSCPIQI